MISKELLKEVLSYPMSEFVDFVKQNNDYIKYGARVQDQINIYELAHKCKEWAYRLNYKFDITEDKIKISIQKDLPCYLATIQNNCQPNNFIPFDTYIDIKASEWILNNIES